MHILELTLWTKPVVRRIPDNCAPINHCQLDPHGNDSLHWLPLLLRAFAWIAETGDGWTSCKGPAWESAAVPILKVLSCGFAWDGSTGLLIPPSTLLWSCSAAASSSSIAELLCCFLDFFVAVSGSRGSSWQRCPIFRFIQRAHGRSCTTERS